MIRRSILLVALTIAVVPSCSAAIARSGSCVAASTSCTFSSTATGTLKIVIAVGASLPSLPSGWTSVLTQTASASAFFVRVGCNVSSSSGDTGSGTWTSAVRVDGISYTGTGVISTANCNTTGIGAILSATGNGTTITYSALTLQKTNGTSWVVGFGTGSASSPATPAGMTSINSIGNTSAQDTNAGVSSWTAQTVSTASQRWATNMLEILALVPSASQIGGFLVGP